jgi:hypothetical protein
MKTCMKNILAILSLVTVGFTAQAQVKIGDNPTTINGGSLLELESTNKGLLMPRVSLTNTTTWGLAGTPAAGMHVYNTNTGITSSNTSYPTLAAKIGEYYWNGTGWVALAPVGIQETSVIMSVSQAANQAIGSGAAVKINFDAIVYDKNATFNLALDQFTVPADAAGYYQINGYWTTAALTTGGQGGYMIAYVNGVSRRVICVGNAEVNAGVGAGGAVCIKLDAGDVIDIRIDMNKTVSLTSSQVDFYLISK